MSLLESVAVVKALHNKRFASGTESSVGPDVSLTTGLATVDHCGVSLAGVPNMGHFISIATPSSTEGKVRIRSYKPTATDDVSPTAVAATIGISWWAIGT